MSKIRKVIYTLLTTDADVSSIVGTKVFPVVAPQDTDVPYITWDIINVDPHGTKSGASDLDKYLIQFDVVESNYTRVSDLSIKLREAIDRYPVQATIAGVLIDGVDYSNETDIYDEEMNLHIKQVDYYFRIK
jgi:hypothetical protein